MNPILFPLSLAFHRRVATHSSFHQVKKEKFPKAQKRVFSIVSNANDKNRNQNKRHGGRFQSIHKQLIKLAKIKHKKPRKLPFDSVYFISNYGFDTDFS